MSASTDSASGFGESEIEGTNTMTTEITRRFVCDAGNHRVLRVSTSHVDNEWRTHIIIDPGCYQVSTVRTHDNQPNIEEVADMVMNRVKEWGSRGIRL